VTEPENPDEIVSQINLKGFLNVLRQTLLRYDFVQSVSRKMITVRSCINPLEGLKLHGRARMAR
jgi:hypothetical protein